MREGMMRVRDVLKLKGDALYAIEPQSRLADAVKQMVEHDVGSLVVMRDGRMSGLVTFREVLSALDAGGGQLGEVRVADVMLHDPVCASPEDTVDHMRATMTERHIRYLPIVDGGRLLGILSFHDVARAALKQASFENQLLKQYIKNWPEDDAAAGSSGGSPVARP
jgi:CBS domain-containing protein